MMIDWPAVSRRLGYNSEHEMWEDLYTEQKLAITALADRFGVSHSTVRDAIRRVGLETRSRGGPNRGPDPRWPPDDELVRDVEEHGAVAMAEKLGFSYSAVYKRARKIRRGREND